MEELQAWRYWIAARRDAEIMIGILSGLVKPNDQTNAEVQRTTETHRHTESTSPLNSVEQAILAESRSSINDGKELERVRIKFIEDYIAVDSNNVGSEEDEGWPSSQTNHQGDSD